MEHSDDINGRVSNSIAYLLDLELDGCITGSCVLNNDFSSWATEPDIDFFGYTMESWQWAVAQLHADPRYKIGSKKEAWKLSRIAMGKGGSHNKKWLTQTIYFEDTQTGILVNLSYKPGTSNIMDVLSRFDTIAIMVGICCRTKVQVDLRKSFHSLDHYLPVGTDGQANPIRLWYMAVS